MTQQKRFNIGIYGSASIADRSFIPAILSLPDLFRLSGIASRDPSKAARLADKHNTDYYICYDDLLNDPDVDCIYLPQPTKLHYKTLFKCLTSGKHVYVEKAFSSSPDETRILTHLASLNSLVIFEGLMFIHHPQHSLVQNILLEKRIGNIRSFSSSFCFPPLNPFGFRYDLSLSSGVIHDATPYPLRALRLFFGDALDLKSTILHTNQSHVPIWGSSFFTTSEGVPCTLHYGFDNYYQCNYQITGTHGILTAHKAFTPKPNEVPRITLQCDEMTIDLPTKCSDHFVDALRSFHQALICNRTREELYTDILKQTHFLALIEAAS